VLAELTCRLPHYENTETKGIIHLCCCGEEFHGCRRTSRTIIAVFTECSVKTPIHSFLPSVRQFLGLFRLKPFPTVGSDGRSKERLRRALLTSSSAVIVRLISMAGPLITVPLALGYLGRERYGLWVTVVSIIGMFSFADLGLGNGLMTEISQADGRGDIPESRRCIGSAFVSLSGIAVVLLCAYAMLFPFVPWGRILNATSQELLRESGSVATVCFLLFLMNLPLSVVPRTQGGLQLGFQSNLWQLLGSALNVIVVVTAVKAHAGLPLLVFFTAGVQPLVSFLNGVVFFSSQRPDLRPRLEDFCWPTAIRLLATGFWFFLVSILMAIGIYSDNLIVAHVIGLPSVPLYSLPASLAVYMGTIASMFCTPFWAANGEALARGDIDWVRRTTLRVVKLNVVLTGAAALLFVVAGPVVLHFWIGLQFSPGRCVFGGMAAWAFVTSVAGPLFMILNGANAVRVQVFIFGSFAVASIILKVALAQRLGIAGVAWGSVVPYVCIVVPGVILAAKTVLRRAHDATLVGHAVECSAKPASAIP